MDMHASAIQLMLNCNVFALQTQSAILVCGNDCHHKFGYHRSKSSSPEVLYPCEQGMN